MRTAVKAFKAAAERSGEEAGDLLNPTISLVDKSVQKGILHRNKGNRIKSALAKAANKARVAA